MNKTEKIQTKATMKKKMYYLRNTRLAYLRELAKTALTVHNILFLLCPATCSRYKKGFHRRQTLQTNFIKR